MATLLTSTANYSASKTIAAETCQVTLGNPTKTFGTYLGNGRRYSDITFLRCNDATTSRVRLPPECSSQEPIQALRISQVAMQTNESGPVAKRHGRRLTDVTMLDGVSPFMHYSCFDSASLCTNARNARRAWSQKQLSQQAESAARDRLDPLQISQKATESSPDGKDIELKICTCKEPKDPDGFALKRGSSAPQKSRSTSVVNHLGTKRPESPQQYRRRSIVKIEKQRQKSSKVPATKHFADFLRKERHECCSLSSSHLYAAQ
eukprot:TRINITY_DN96018_c0_g1_i1.p1 TRINITY_DN96018_c0_g1~~TRINITY_DN96018_c0_g1_i1.p1  ORF type:complete len:263 (+),score=45.19 TRINITY_DN96018_c0_g1_i1:85-873(+)